MKVKPLGDRILIKIQESENKTAGGIIIPQTAQEKTQNGVVVSVGPGTKDDKGVLEPLPVAAGQKVMFDKYAGAQIKIDGVDHLIVKFSDVLAVIE
jgi:chaperonin GroES